MRQDSARPGMQNRQHPFAQPAQFPRPAGGTTRNSSVIGAPSTSSTGTTMFNVIWVIMCRLNIAYP